jgi:hypothetical protein
MRHTRIIFAKLVLFASILASINKCVAAEPQKDAAFYQNVLDHGVWSWSDSYASIF